MQATTRQLKLFDEVLTKCLSLRLKLWHLDQLKNEDGLTYKPDFKIEPNWTFSLKVKFLLILLLSILNASLYYSAIVEIFFVQNALSFVVMQEASDVLSKTADSDTVLTYQVSSVQLMTDKKLEAFNKA